MKLTRVPPAGSTALDTSASTRLRLVLLPAGALSTGSWKGGSLQIPASPPAPPCGAPPGSLRQVLGRGRGHVPAGCSRPVSAFQGSCGLLSQEPVCAQQARLRGPRMRVHAATHLSACHRQEPQPPSLGAGPQNIGCLSAALTPAPGQRGSLPLQTVTPASGCCQGPQEGMSEEAAAALPRTTSSPGACVASAPCLWCVFLSPLSQMPVPDPGHTCRP